MRLPPILQQAINQAVGKAVMEAMRSDEFARLVRAAVQDECAICGVPYARHEDGGPPHCFEPMGSEADWT